MGRLGWTEITVLLVLALLLFGAKRLPDMARSVGRSIQEFKKGLSQSMDDSSKDKDKKE